MYSGIWCYIVYYYVDSASFHGSVQGESDSEPEGLISTLHNTLDSLLSSDSDSDSDNSDIIATTQHEKPVFLTSRGPIDAGLFVFVVSVLRRSSSIHHCKL